MTGRFRPHQTLKAEGRLSEWSQEMVTIFVSQQLQVLQSMLSNLIAKNVKIQNAIASQLLSSACCSSSSSSSSCLVL